MHQERSDPRRALAEALVKGCGKKGSVVVYNQQFKKSRNKELADLFPDLSADILAINERVVDQLIPFRNRYLYSPKQKSSASIKYVLPAFSDLSYKGMNIANGGDAMNKYLAFLNGTQSEEENKQMFADLLKYCGQDTYAMVLLMDMLYKWAEQTLQILIDICKIANFIGRIIIGAYRRICFATVRKKWVTRMTVLGFCNIFIMRLQIFNAFYYLFQTFRQILPVLNMSTVRQQNITTG